MMTTLKDSCQCGLCGECCSSPYDQHEVLDPTCGFPGCPEDPEVMDDEGPTACGTHRYPVRVLADAAEAGFPDVSLPSGLTITVNREPGRNDEDWEDFVVRATEEELGTAQIPLIKSWCWKYTFLADRGILSDEKRMELENTIRVLIPHWADHGELPLWIHFYPFVGELV